MVNIAASAINGRVRIALNLASGFMVTTIATNTANGIKIDSIKSPTKMLSP